MAKFSIFHIFTCIILYGSGYIKATVKESGLHDFVEAIPNEFPWLVRIKDGTENQDYLPCHGAILDANWIVTMNYRCTSEPSSTITIIAGDHDILVDESTEQIRGVLRKILTPGVSRQDEFELQVRGEISLIQLDSPLVFNEFVQPIKFASPDTVYTSDNVTKVFWRQMLEPSAPTKLMKNTAQTTMADAACLNYYEIIETFPYYVTFEPETVICSDTFVFLSPKCQLILGEPMTCQTADGPVLCGIGQDYSNHCTDHKLMKQFDFTIPNTFTDVGSPRIHEWILNRTTLHPETNETWVAQDIGCGGVLTGSAGRLSYKPEETTLPNERCTWTIRAEDFSSVRIHAVQTDLGPNDILLLSDLNGEEPGEFTATPINGAATVEYIVRGPFVFITFQSDAEAPGRGFILEFYGSGLDTALDADVTDVHLNAPTGTFHYPADEEFYPWSGIQSSGDSGYGLEERLLTPYSEDDIRSHRIFNNRQKQARSSVERAIGNWKSRFRSIDKTGGTLCYNEIKACKIIIATATLHNICIDRRIPLLPEDENHRDVFVIPELIEYRQGAPQPQTSRQQAKQTMELNGAKMDVKSRSAKFSQAEKMALSESIKDRHAILFGALTPQLTKQHKNKAWAEVLCAVNAVSSVVRTLNNVKEKFKNMKKEVKATASHNSKEIRRTGGGSADIIEMDACSENVLATIPRAAITGIADGFDTSDFAGLDTNSEYTFEFTPQPTTNNENIAELQNSLPSQPLSLLTYSSNAVQPSFLPPTFTSAAKSEEITTPQRKKMAKDLRSPTEILLEKQVELFSQQLEEMKSIRRALERRNELEEEKLELKKNKLYPD